MTYIGYIPLAGWTVWSTKGTETTDAAIANFIHSSCTLISYVTRWPEVFLHVIDTKPTNVPHTLLTVFSSSARHHISTSQVHNNNLHRSLNRITLPTLQPPLIQYNCVSSINRGLQAPTLPWLRFHPTFNVLSASRHRAQEAFTDRSSHGRGSTVLGPYNFRSANLLCFSHVVFFATLVGDRYSNSLRRHRVIPECK